MITGGLVYLKDNIIKNEGECKDFDLIYSLAEWHRQQTYNSAVLDVKFML